MWSTRGKSRPTNGLNIEEFPVINITVVVKVKVNGSLCRKSALVWEKLQQAQLLNQIDRIVFAHENKPSSQGLSLAIQHQITAAPFFIVEQEDGSTQVYTAYSHFFQKVLNYQISEIEEISEIMASNPDLDFI